MDPRDEAEAEAEDTQSNEDPLLGDNDRSLHGKGNPGEGGGNP